jgi:hypothetical protein
MNSTLPARGFFFAPVGNGDSTTVIVDPGAVLQVDLHHMVCADDKNDTSFPIVDELVRLLPKVNGRPYLSTFALTHPDDDHCCGFADLSKRVTIGELWFTPRIFVEHQDDMCDDACAFQEEALRRVKATVAAGGLPKSGDRVRIVGRDDILNEEPFKGFPKGFLTIPGNEITQLDGRELAGRFRAFVHAPFKDDVGCERNDSSLGLQISLIEGRVVGTALLLGDLCYPTVKRIFDISQPQDLLWNVFLAPHHCSKSVMYWQDAGETEETLKQSLLNQIESAAQRPAYIIASSAPVPIANKPRDNPPHTKAKARYEEIAPDGFHCTMEHPSEANPLPIVLEMTPTGLRYLAPEASASARTPDLIGAIAAARGSAEPPKDRVGFGRQA